MENKETLTFDQLFNNITNKAVIQFQDDILDQLVIDSDSFDESVTELLTIDDSGQLFDYIMNHDYWIRLWSIFLVKQIMDLVYE